MFNTLLNVVRGINAATTQITKSPACLRSQGFFFMLICSSVDGHSPDKDLFSFLGSEFKFFG